MARPLWVTGSTGLGHNTKSLARQGFGHKWVTSRDIDRIPKARQPSPGKCLSRCKDKCRTCDTHTFEQITLTCCNWQIRQPHHTGEGNEITRCLCNAHVSNQASRYATGTALVKMSFGTSARAARQYAFTSARLGKPQNTAVAPGSRSNTWSWAIFQEVYIAGLDPSDERSTQ